MYIYIYIYIYIRILLDGLTKTGVRGPMNAGWHGPNEN